MRHEATLEELANWDELVMANPSSGDVLQTKAFAAVKGRHGWQPHYMTYNLGGTRVAVVYFSRKIPLLGELWYAPKAPGVANVEQLAQITRANLDLPAFLIKMEPELLQSADMSKTGLIKAKRDIQYNNHTVIVDLKPSEDNVLASFKQKTRYNVRLGLKKEVTVEAVDATDENCQIMYGLMSATQDRAGFFLRSFEYFSDFWQTHAKATRGQMFFAKYQGQILAGAFVTHLGSKALYKDGGSLREHSDVQAPYVLQWEIMRWLKAHDVKAYDLHGTPPASEIDNPNHPLAGLARFKTGFGSEVVDFVGTYDQVLDASKYAIWNRLGERLVAKYFIKVKKQLLY